MRRRIAIIPFGSVDQLRDIDGVDWLAMKRPHLGDARGCQALVADFSADLPDEWEAFLADAALAGRMVYQVKQLAESLTGRVQLEQLSENSFGSLLPARGYFYLKGLADFMCRAGDPAAGPAVHAPDRRLDPARQSGPGPVPPETHRSCRAADHRLQVPDDAAGPDVEDDRNAAMTQDDDQRITRAGRVLRKLRIDELPQIINILKWQMSWIGPRPEAEVLSVWYTSEIPFYRYRHVVKPGISGWAQVNQGHVAEVDEVHRKLQYDFYYIKYFSPWFDLLILFRTIKTMLTGFGSR